MAPEKQRVIVNRTVSQIISAPVNRPCALDRQPRSAPPLAALDSENVIRACRDACRSNRVSGAHWPRFPMVAICDPGALGATTKNDVQTSTCGLPGRSAFYLAISTYCPTLLRFATRTDNFFPQVSVRNKRQRKALQGSNPEASAGQSPREIHQNRSEKQARQRGKSWGAVLTKTTQNRIAATTKILSSGHQRAP